MSYSRKTLNLFCITNFLLLTTLCSVQTLVWGARVPSCNAPKFDGHKEVEKFEDPMVQMLDEVLRENESLGGRAAYCLTDARMTNGLNGLSFGPNQLDLATNTESLPYLLNLINRLTKEREEADLTDSEIGRIRNGALSKKATLIRQDADESLQTMMLKVNLILRSDAARQVMNSDYANHLQQEVSAINESLKDINNKVGGRTLIAENPFAKLLILDYQNFFGKRISGLKSYLSGNTVRIGYPVKTVGPIVAPASLSDLIHYALSTKQGSGAARDERPEMLRRINTIVRVSKRHHGAFRTSSKDSSYFRGSLKQMLEAESVAGRGNRYAALWELAQ